VKTARLVLSCLVFGGGALMGAGSTLDSGMPLGWGVAVGGAFGLALGALIGGKR
jgi:hypothetical protein